MYWPWKRKKTVDRLVVGCQADVLAWLQADAVGTLRRCGVEQRGDDTAHEFARRVRGLGLPSKQVCAVLPLAQGQLLQIEAPPVKPEEMKAAARWHIKELVDGPLEALTIDVMFVGDDRPRPHRNLFVAAADTVTIRDIGERTRSAGLELAVIDIAETAQRNLQSALATAEGLAGRATAALMRHGEQCVLTICADGELYYARRLDWDGSVLEAAPVVEAPPVEALDTMDFIDYGDGSGDVAPGDAGAPRLVIELQRSFDVWDRSWPDLPLAALWVQVGDSSATLAASLEASLGQRVGVLDPERLFPGFDAGAASPGARALLLPMLGALLRSETRRL
jgi:MSHA biogenesis protein MshI